MSNGDEKTTSRETPVACRLSDTELRKREATLLAQFIKAAVISTEELENGYAFHVRGDKESMALVGELIAAERDCCRFLKFEPDCGWGHGASYPTHDRAGRYE